MGYDDIRVGADGLWLPLEGTIPAISGTAGLEDADSPAVIDLHFFQLNISPLSDTKTVVVAIAVGCKCARDNEGIRVGSCDLDRDGIESVTAVTVGAFDGIGGGIVDAGDGCGRVGIVQAG